MRTSKNWIPSFVILAAVLGFVAPASAETPDGVLRVFAGLANPSGDYSTTFDFGMGPVAATLEADSAVSFGILYEVRVNDLVGVDTGIYFADFDFEAKALGSSADFGSSLAIPVTLGANFHVAGNDQVDFYLGPFLAYTTWGDLEGPFGIAETDSDFGLGAVIGADFRKGDSRWTFSTALRYLQVAAGDSSLEIDVDPLFVEIGVGYRF